MVLHACGSEYGEAPPGKGISMLCSAFWVGRWGIGHLRGSSAAAPKVGRLGLCCPRQLPCAGPEARTETQTAQSLPVRILHNATCLTPFKWDARNSCAGPFHAAPVTFSLPSWQCRKRGGASAPWEAGRHLQSWLGGCRGEQRGHSCSAPDLLLPLSLDSHLSYGTSPSGTTAVLVDISELKTPANSS